MTTRIYTGGSLQRAGQYVRRGGLLVRSKQSLLLPEGGDIVSFPNSQIGFIAGPQLVSGSALNPWPWFDSNAYTRGLVHGENFPAEQPEDPTGYYEAHYYDLTLCLYIAYFRTGDPALLAMARKCADSWYASDYIEGGGFSNSYVAPRASALSGLMLRALDGKPEYWPGLLTLALDQYSIWLGLRIENETLHYGIRDGAFALKHVAQMSVAHPDSETRDELAFKALDAAVNYYVRLQDADGGWYWDPDNDAEAPQTTNQPFEVGMLLDGLIDVHRNTGNADVLDSIVAANGFLWDKGYEQSPVTNLEGVNWRAMRYFVYKGEELSIRDSALRYGIEDGAMRDERQLNPLCIPGFGYAYHVTGDPVHKTRGDEIFAATYGHEGPGVDDYYCLADWNEKSYNQANRSAGKHLVWRQ